MASQKGSCIMGQCREGQFCDLTKGGYRVVKGLRARSPPDGGQGIAPEADKLEFMHEPIITYGSSNQPERMSFKRNKFPLLR